MSGATLSGALERECLSSAGTKNGHLLLFDLYLEVKDG